MKKIDKETDAPIIAELLPIEFLLLSALIFVDGWLDGKAMEGRKLGRFDGIVVNFVGFVDGWLEGRKGVLVGWEDGLITGLTEG